MAHRPMTPADLRGRRWFQPIVNFGQLVASPRPLPRPFLAAVPEHRRPQVHRPSTPACGGNRPRIGARVDRLRLHQLSHGAVHRQPGYGRLEVRPWSRHRSDPPPDDRHGFPRRHARRPPTSSSGPPPSHSSRWCSSSGIWRSSRTPDFARPRSPPSGGSSRRSRPRTSHHGHTERVARFAEMIGKQMGFDGTQLERLRWAALIHDVGKLAVPATSSVSVLVSPTMSTR